MWNTDSDSTKRVISLSLLITDFSGTLDASDLTALEELDCGINIGLTKLILPQSGSLTYLQCYNMGITELDVSGSLNLISLKCSNTDITALNVSQNTALENLSCEGTQITELDLSTNQSLKSLSLPESLETLKTSGETSGRSIILTQTQGGKIMLSLNSSDSGDLYYTLEAKPESGYEFVRWQGVDMTNFENGTTEKDAIVYFKITGDMNISAEFSEEERLSLASLAVEGVTLTPAFSSDILNYTAVVPYDVTSINIVAEGMADYDYTITGTGKHELEVGENTFVVAVIVPKVPGDPNINETLRKEYVITVTRQADSESTDVPPTGDDSTIGLWVGLMLIGFAGAIVWTAAWGRKRTN